MQTRKNWTVKEAAEFLEVSVQRVHVFIKNKEFEAEKSGRDWEVDPKTCKEFKKKDRPVGNPNFRKNAKAC